MREKISMRKSCIDLTMKVLVHMTTKLFYLAGKKIVYWKYKNENFFLSQSLDLWSMVEDGYDDL